jgi:hypothetical protein
VEIVRIFEGSVLNLRLMLISSAFPSLFVSISRDVNDALSNFSELVLAIASLT